MARQRTGIPFGGGVDRDSGVMTVEPSAFADLRNTHLHNGRAELRKGLCPRVGLDAVTDIIAVHAIRSTGIGLVVGYNSSTRVVSLWVTSGSDVGKVADLPWSISSAAASPPRVSLADSYDKVLIAHDEPIFALRNVTIQYDVNSGIYDNLLTPALGAVKFRGVTTYLAYIIGWGYGTEDDPDRPEIVRASLPAEPTNFDVNHYWVAGQRGDPVLRCDEAGDVLTVRKQSESYDIFGTDRSNFGIRRADRLFGIAGSRLGVTIGGVNYFWSLEGPRRSAGGPSEDLALNLDLAGPVPDSLAGAPDYAYGFAVYLPARREILFVFGAWAYVLHIADKSAMRWSYRPFGVNALCGGILYDPTPSIDCASEAARDTSAVPWAFWRRGRLRFTDALTAAADGDQVREWRDYMGNLTRTWANDGGIFHNTSVQPKVDGNAVQFGHGPAGTGATGLDLAPASLLGALGEAQLMVRLRVDHDPALADGQAEVMSFGSHAFTQYPSTAGHVFDNWGANTQIDLGDPATDLTQYHVFSVRASGTRGYRAKINNAVLVDIDGATFAPLFGFTGLGAQLGIMSGAGFGKFEIEDMLIVEGFLNASQEAAWYDYLTGVTTTPPLPGEIEPGAAGSLAPACSLTLTVDATTPTQFSLTQPADVTGDLLGGEVVEWWVRSPVNSLWTINRTTPLPLGTTSVTQLLGTLLAGSPYDVAVRVKRNGMPGVGYTSTNPLDWPSTSRRLATGATTLDNITAVSLSQTTTGGGAHVLTIVLGGAIALQQHVSYKVQADFGSGFADYPGETSNFIEGKTQVDMTAHIGAAVSVRVRQATTWATSPAWSASLSTTIV